MLTLLQSTETNYSGDLHNGALGHYYHYLITQSLGRARVRPEQLEEIFNYCSNLAWIYCQTNCRELGRNEILQFNDAYSKKYVHVDLYERLEMLCNAKILNKRGNYYSFSYPYTQYYFLGKYLADNLSNEESVRPLVKKYCGHLYVRSYANTILFLVHHSRDSFIIDSILETIRGLFSGSPPILLDNDASFINDFVDSTSRLVFSGGEPEENRRSSREMRDKIDEMESDALEMDGEAREELDLPSRLNILFKTVEILGQLLKSYYGTLTIDTKRGIMHEVYEGPLRALRVFMEVLERNHGVLVHEIENVIGNKNKDMLPNKRTQSAKRIIFEVVGMFTHGFLFKSSSAVGSEYLHDVARSLVDENGSIAFKLIELGTLLDAPSAIPFERIEKLSRQTENNVLAHRVLEAIVLRHLYLFKSSDKDKQRLCEMLGVSVERQRNIDVKTSRAKLVERGS